MSEEHSRRQRTSVTLRACCVVALFQTLRAYSFMSKDLKQELPAHEILCGAGGIRTHGAVTPSGFQDQRISPLCHGSKTQHLILISVA